MREITIIQLSGKQGSGKTTLAKRLREKIKENHDTTVYIMKFADPIYELHHACRDVLREYNVRLEDKPDKRLLQLLGTEWARETLGQNIWRDIFLNRVEKSQNYLYTKTLFVINDDLRFRNEILDEAIHIRLEAPEEVRRKRTESWREQTKHISETDLDSYKEWDLVLNTHLDSVEENLEKIMALVQTDQSHQNQGDK